MTASILLVDDNAVQAATRKAVLERAGFHLFTAGSAAEALSKLDDPAVFASIGLVITDHLMPGMNGPEFVTALRRLSATLPVLVITGLPFAETQYESLDVLFRVKPFPPDQLIALTRSILSEPMSRTA